MSTSTVAEATFDVLRRFGVDRVFGNPGSVVITAGQQTRAMLPTDPYLCSPQPTVLAASYVKWTVEPARAAGVPVAIARALITALTPPSGPVFVSVPEDD